MKVHQWQSGFARPAPWLRPTAANDRRPPSTPRWQPVPAVALPTDGGSHPLADHTLSQALRQRGDEIAAAFDAIEPALRELGPLQFEAGFAAEAAALLQSRLGLSVAPELLATDWARPLDVRLVHAHLVLATFCRLVERGFDRELAARSDGESVEALIRRWGFHAIDITPCADGRLAGVVDYILRVPPAVVMHRQSHAGAMFDVEAALRRWERVELHRWRDGRPNAAAEATRYLKIGVYHFSSLDPRHQGCAAHGSDDGVAAAALLERLRQFEHAVQQTHGAGAAVATLLVGVDTDTDAIRVHVPDASGAMSVERYLCNRQLYTLTRPLPREGAKDAIRHAVAASAGVAADDDATEGMRWLCGYLLKNNLGQVDAVRSRHGQGYADRGHTERLIVVGDAIDDVQLRNLAFQAQMDTVEEGAADLDVGIRILRGLHAPRGLAVPVLVHFRFDPRIGGSQQRARLRALRLRAAIEARYAELGDGLRVQAVVRGGDGGALMPVEPLRGLVRPDPSLEQHP